MKHLPRVMILVVALSMFACGSDDDAPQTRCGEGTVLIDGSCEVDEVDHCGEGTELDDDGQCIPVDPANQVDPPDCGEGTELDESTNECVPSSTIECGERTVEIDGQCRPTEEQLWLDADYDLNDESDLRISDAEGQVTIRGTLSDVDDQMSFTVDAPQVDLVSLSLVGLENSAQRFEVEGQMDLDYLRHSTTRGSTLAERTLLWPEPGDYDVHISPKTPLDEGADNQRFVFTIDVEEVPQTLYIEEDEPVEGQLYPEDDPYLYALDLTVLPAVVALHAEHFGDSNAELLVFDGDLEFMESVAVDGLLELFYDNDGDELLFFMDYGELRGQDFDYSLTFAEGCDPDAGDFGGGDGSSSSAYRLCHSDHISAFSEYDFDGESFILLSDIDLQGVDLSPAPAFDGHFHGNGYTLENLEIIEDDEDIAFIHTIAEDGVVESLNFQSAHVVGTQNVGTLTAHHHGYIHDVHAYDSNLADDDIASTGDFGGIAGVGDGDISHSSAEVFIDSVWGSGGIIGSSLGGTISHSSASGEITSGDYVGGLVGYCDECDAYRTSSSVQVNGGFFSGGLIGDFYGGEIYKSYATGEVSGVQDIGGLVGWSQNITVIDSFSKGDVTLGDDDFSRRRFGGLIGRTRESDVSNSYSTGSVVLDHESITDAGILFGEARDSHILNVYGLGEVIIDGSDESIFIGYDDNLTVTSTYYLSDDGSSLGDLGSPLELADFYDVDAFVDWDFDALWQMSDDEERPMLRWYAE